MCSRYTHVHKTCHSLYQCYTAITADILLFCSCTYAMRVAAYHVIILIRPVSVPYFQQQFPLMFVEQIVKIEVYYK